jgi:hypothetical protein
VFIFISDATGALFVERALPLGLARVIGRRCRKRNRIQDTLAADL